MHVKQWCSPRETLIYHPLIIIVLEYLYTKIRFSTPTQGELSGLAVQIYMSFTKFSMALSGLIGYRAYRF